MGETGGGMRQIPIKATLLGRRGHGVVFAHDAPPCILLAEPHGEAKFEVDFLACAQIAASANRSGKCHLGARCDTDVVKIELHRPGGPVVEHIPRRHVCVQPTGQEGWGASNIKMSGS
jgi:hypothetical protein